MNSSSDSPTGNVGISRAVECSESTSVAPSSHKDAAIAHICDDVQSASMAVAKSDIFTSSLPSVLTGGRSSSSDHRICSLLVQDEDVLACQLAMPARPRTPSDSDCCHSGCERCVFDVHKERLTTWRRHLMLRCSGDNSASDETILSDDNGDGVSCEIERVTQMSSDTYLYRFRLPSVCENCSKNSVLDCTHQNRRLLSLPLAGHLVARENLQSNADEFIERSYTPVTDPLHLPTALAFDVFVRVYCYGRMSRIISNSWTLGHKVLWRRPSSSPSLARISALIQETLDCSEGLRCRRLVLLAGGTGIAPLLQIARHLVTLDECCAHVCLLICARHLCSVLGREELLTDLSSHWNFSYRLFISDLSQVWNDGKCCADCVSADRCTGFQHLSPAYGEPVERRRIEMDDVIAAVQPPSLARRNAPQSIGAIVCGPLEFNDTMQRHLASAGCISDNVIRL